MTPNPRDNNGRLGGSRIGTGDGSSGRLGPGGDSRSVDFLIQQEKGKE